MIVINKMGTEKNTTDSVLEILLKEPFHVHTATSLAKALHITRQGIWRVLNELAKDKLIALEYIGNTKTSAAILKLNWDNPVTEKTLSLLLTKESLQQQRWIVNFRELEKQVDFLILFGSILTNPKEANDIDMIAVVHKRNFKLIEDITAKIQQTQMKKIHLIALTLSEFNDELKKPNAAHRDAVKKGIILFGQEKFIRFMMRMSQK